MRVAGSGLQVSARGSVVAGGNIGSGKAMDDGTSDILPTQRPRALIKVSAIRWGVPAMCCWAAFFASWRCLPVCIPALVASLGCVLMFDRTLRSAEQADRKRWRRNLRLAMSVLVPLAIGSHFLVTHDGEWLWQAAMLVFAELFGLRYRQSLAVYPDTMRLPGLPNPDPKP